jgi:hypothetical protein
MIGGRKDNRLQDPQPDRPQRALEIKLHVRGALSSGVTAHEINADCGIPTVLGAFRPHTGCWLPRVHVEGNPTTSASSMTRSDERLMSDA